jgi:quinol monooxygenase YgiN
MSRHDFGKSFCRPLNSEDKRHPAPMSIDHALASSVSQVESGCPYYRFSADLERPTTFYLTEEWDSEDALQSHLRAPHFAEFVADLAKHHVQRRQKAETASWRRTRCALQAAPDDRR